MHRTILWTLACLFIAASAARAWYPYSEKYTNWQKDRPMLFGALHNCVPRDHLPERIERFKAAGLNTLIWLKVVHGEAYFRAAHDAGMEWGAAWRGGSDEELARIFTEVPGLNHVTVVDEPNDEDENYARIEELIRKMNEVRPDIPAFSNLSIAEFDHERYITQCKPDVFSFDHYPLQRNGETQDTCLYNLMWGRQSAQRHKLPYWMWLQAYGREAERPSYAYRVPDEADIRFLVFTFLAHGGTGIKFFLYYGMNESMVLDPGIPNPGSSGAPEQKYENSIRTRAWYAVRDVAPEVQVLARALLNLRSKDPVGYIGDGAFWDRNAPGYALQPVEPFRLAAFEGHGALKSVLLGGQPGNAALVGFLDDEAGQDYFMVVNLVHGLNMSKMDGMRKLRLVFSAEVEQIERVNRLTGLVETLRTQEGSGATRVLDIQLEGGTGDLFKWSNGNPWDLRPHQ